MILKTFHLLVLCGLSLAAFDTFQTRVCDPEPATRRPTVCVNHYNTRYLKDTQTRLQTNQRALEERVETLERDTTLHFRSAERSINALERLVSNLSRALGRLEQAQAKTQMEFRDLEAQLQTQADNITSMKADIGKLVRFKERVGGNITEVAERLDVTERQLTEEKAKLDRLETETEDAFSDTSQLLSLYGSELSRLNTTAREVEGRFDARLRTTKTELKDELREIRNSSEEMKEKLDKQKAEADEFMEETGNKFTVVGDRLTSLTKGVDGHETDIDSLRRNLTGLINSGSERRTTEDLRRLKTEVHSLKAEVSAKVAFSAAIVTSPDVFTGPGVPSQTTLIFNQVFTNIGNAYDDRSGTFTAPLRGVYHFSFMTFGYSAHSSGAVLVKNGVYQVSTWEFKGLDTSDTTSNTVILQLNPYDRINIILWEGGKVHTSVFSGFLICVT